MTTATPPVNDTVHNHESITVPDVLAYVSPAAWSVAAVRASSQILTLAVAAAAVRANVKGSRVSAAAMVAAVAATTVHQRRRKTTLLQDAFLKEFGITLEGAPLRLAHLTKALKDGGLPVVASADGVQGIYTLHEKDDRIFVNDPAGVTLPRISRP